MALTEPQVTALRDVDARERHVRIPHLRRQRRRPQPPSKTRPELEVAVTSGVVTLDQLIEARRLGRPGADADDRAAYCDYWPRLLDTYQQANGRVVEQFFTKHIDAAAVLTSRAELRMTYPAESVATVQPEFEEALWRAAAMVRQGKELLDGRARMLLLRSLHSLIVYLLGVLDSFEPVTDAEERKHRIQAALTCAEHELDRNQAYLDQASMAAAQKRYLLGMPLGVLVVTGLVLLLGRMQVKDVDVATALVILVAGGIGAVVSVMARMTRGDLTIDSDASRLIIWSGGFFRPILGAILALAVYALMLAALVPIAKPESGDQLAFFGGIAFLAGFSERWAQDMLVRTTRGIGTETPRTTSIVPSGRHRGQTGPDPDPD